MLKSFLSRADARWAVVGIFALSNTLNFLDRQILTSLAPQLKTEFGITNAGFGDVLMVFSICYGLAAPLAGFFLDRAGLTVGSTIAVALWSLAGMATGWTSSLAGLVACRAALGIAEGGGIPATGKASATYLAPKERAFGSAISQVGLTIGGILAPVLAQWVSLRYGWRWAFFVTGALGFIWIPLWIVVARSAPRSGASHGPQGSELRPMLTDSRFYAVLLSNVLLMSVYSLWVNWTTVFLVSEYGMTQADANYRLAWIPPIFATAGGFFGGWLTLRWTGGSANVTPARMRVILLGSLLLLAGAVVPLMPSAGMAIALVCLSFFACVMSSVNIYSLPLDLFGAGRAGFAIAGLTAVYGLLQGVFSSAVGRIVDAHGFAPVCVAVALAPMASWAVLQVALKRRPA
jgi:ACS family hexuronate transporter-like MFS transporter